MNAADQIRLGADIGGTFTDVVLEVAGKFHSAKALTNHAAPEQSILDGIAVVAAQANIEVKDLDIVIHGTTLATNALIERRGAPHSFRDHGGVSRRDRNAHGEPLRSIRSKLAAAAAARAARAPVSRARADQRARPGIGGAR